MNLPALLSSEGFWTPVVVAVIAAIGVFLTARPALADIGLKRRLETAKRFTELAEQANNVSGAVGLTEQIASIYLIASFGRDEKHLREAARATLLSIQGWGVAAPMGELKTATAARDALILLPTRKGQNLPAKESPQASGEARSPLT